MSIRDAATIVLLKRFDDGLRTLLLRRHRASGFMAGAFVFPGGKLDDDDLAPVTRARAPRVEAIEIMKPTPGRALDDAHAHGLFVAACRETFEEAGALFARRRGEGALVRLDDDARWSDWRKKLTNREAVFSEMLEAEDLELDLTHIHYFDHWVTPSAEPRRFDTRFFVAEVPAGQTPELDRHELVEERWLSPADALSAHYAGELFLPPPTQRTLETLQGASSFEDVAAMAARRAPHIGPVMPKVRVVDGDITILLPWDPLYEETEGESLAAEDPDPEAKRPSRIVLKPAGG
ncbi:MAG: hypothetical protein RIT81_36830 [Deltaproteobacteria bacterium]